MYKEEYRIIINKIYSTLFRIGTTLEDSQQSDCRPLERVDESGEHITVNKMFENLINHIDEFDFVKEMNEEREFKIGSDLVLNSLKEIIDKVE